MEYSVINKSYNGWVLVFLGVLLFTLIAPSFPTFMGNEVYLNLLIFLGSAFLIAIRRFPFQKEELAVLVFYFVLQALIISSWASDVHELRAQFSDLPSLLRPIFLAVTPLAFTYLYFRGGRHPVVFLDKFVSLAICLLLIYFLLDKLGVTSSFKYLLYERKEKFEQYNYFISFFATTYFAAYFYFICFCYCLCRFVFAGGLKWFFAISVLAILIAFAQSKSFYVTSVIVVFVVACLNSGVFFRAFAISVALVTLALIVHFSKEISNLLLVVDLRSFRSLSTIFSGLENSGTFLVRYDQVVQALSSSLDRFGFGVGLGRDVYLESYIASFIYRYGLIGFVAYTIFFLTVSRYAYLAFKSSISPLDKSLFSFVCVWFLLLPLGMLSSPMYETGKNSIFSALVLSSFLYGRIIIRQRS